jgi:uncharacterized tellurite resistance protein B-like protein
MQRVVAKFRTHQEAEEATLAYYRSLTPEQRLEILFQLREFHLKDGDAASQEMARVYRITQLRQD